MQCPNCGSVIPDTAMFCGFCGHHLTQPFKPAGQAIPQPIEQLVITEPTPPAAVVKQRLPRWVRLLIALAVLVSILFILTLIVMLRPRPRQDEGSQLPAVYASPSPAQPTLTVIVEPTQANCTLFTYEVQQNDTLSAIADVFGIPGDKIRLYNHLPSDALSPGMILSLPLCEQVTQTELTPTAEMSIEMTPIIVTLPPDLSQLNKVFGQPEDCNSFKVIQEDYPGGVLVPPNTAFSKTWTLVNLGSCTWTTDYSLVALTDEIVSGDKKQDVWVDIPPGMGIEFVFDLISPSQEGSYEVVWSFRNGQSVEFGRISFLIVVQNP